jgi:photosystem II stability/assembly factor-like uncharacterized protein
MGPAWSDGEERGVFRTRDGGATWERVLYVNERTGVSDLVMDPSNPDKLFVGMWEFRRWPWYFQSGGPGSGLYITQDGGDSWSQATAQEGLPEGELGRIGLTVFRGDPRVVYALVEARPSALLRSNDGGLRWETVNAERGIAPRPFYYADISVDPSNELRLFNLHSRVMRSEDGGTSFQRIGSGVHSDFHALWINPGDSRHLYLGTDGGVFISRDGGDHWRLVDNLPVGQFYHVSVDMAVPFNVYGGMQDNGSWRGPSDLWENGGIRNYHWQEVAFGDGFGTLIDPLDPNLGYAMSQGGRLVRFDLRTGERKGIRPWAPDSTELRFNWNAAIATDPFDAQAIYYGSQFVHKTVDRGNSWQIISGDLTSNDPEKQRQQESGGITRDATGAENHTTILTIAPSPSEKEVIWVGTDDGRVHLTRSSGGNWEEVGQRIRGVPDDTWVPHIEASHHGGGTAYVIFDDHRRGNWTPYIYRTEDYGQRWENLAEDAGIWGFVHTLEEDPLTPNLLFAGTEFGLYVSLNRGADWIPWRQGIPPAPVRSLVIHPRDHDLVVGTHGRALYVVDDIRPLRALAQDPGIRDLPVHLFSPPPAYLRNTAAVDGYHFPADGMFQGETRGPGAMLTYHVGHAGADTTASIQILSPEDSVIRTFQGPAMTGLNRVFWDLREDAQGAGGGSESQTMEVLPGRYSIRVTVDGAESMNLVEVLPDPRVEIPLEDRILKRSAIVRNLALTGVVQQVRERVDTLTGALQGIESRLSARSDEETQELRGHLASVREALSLVEARLEGLSRARSALSSLTSTREAPTEAERIGLLRLADEVDRVVPMINALLTGGVPDFRRALEAAGLEPLPNLSPIRRTDQGMGVG